MRGLCGTTTGVWARARCAKFTERHLHRHWFVSLFPAFIIRPFNHAGTLPRHEAVHTWMQMHVDPSHT